jgi:hypothetical protein
MVEWYVTVKWRWAFGELVQVKGENMQSSLLRAETSRGGKVKKIKADEARQLNLIARGPHDSRLSL